jgi:hypothetical protein
VEATSGQVELGPNTRISGRLRYRSREALKRDPAAQVLGGVEHLAPLRARTGPAVWRWLGRSVFLIWTLGLMLLVTILLLVMPGFLGGVIETLESRPGASALLGFVMLVCIPVAAIILLITLIGAPLSLLCIAAYFVLLVVGYIAAGAAVGDSVLKRLRPRSASATGSRIVAATGGILIVAILGRIPWVGGLVVFAALLMCLGALGLHMKRTLQSVAQ